MVRFSLGNTVNYFGREVFDTVQFPPGFDKETFIDTLLDEFGEMPISGNIQRFPSAVRRWGIRSKYAMERLWGSVNVDYNPIENYDRYEDSTDSGKDNNTSTASGSSVNSDISYDDKLAHDSSKVDSKSTGTGKRDFENKRISHIHGNIGVTTAPKMLKEERSISRYDVYYDIAQWFASELLITIY